ncbi:MAG: hypothetical protein HC790_05940, partial [Acaryochloridaceae cyanobacterium CSU_3_4]|nr:hypothetical protein [Acaryochloridaceae cyanobacterium CSU_3_4]
MIPPAGAEEPARASVVQPTDERLSAAEPLAAPGPNPQPATTVKDWMAQIEASLVQITGVQVESTDAGISVNLATQGELPAPTTE